jgi:hypothetical protein
MTRQSLDALRKSLGAPQGYQSNPRALPLPEYRVMWACGCEAVGPGFTLLTLEPCARHRALVEAPLS